MNKFIGIGRITKEIELRYTQQANKPFCNFNIAIDRKFKKGEGKDHPEADFLPCQAWDKTAEFISKYFQKGSKIAITGRINTRNYEDKEGKKVYVTEIIVEECFFCEGKKEVNESIKSDEDDSELPF